MRQIIKSFKKKRISNQTITYFDCDSKKTNWFIFSKLISLLNEKIKPDLLYIMVVKFANKREIFSEIFPFVFVKLN